jgi:hypothetical protein
MADLPLLLTFPRVIRHLAHVGADLPPDEAVALDAPGPVLGAALAAAAGGDFAPARALLAASREQADWAERSRLVRTLSDHALLNRGWLDSWLDVEPDDGDAWLVKARLMVDDAWAIRTGARAEHVSKEQFQAFHSLLGDAIPVIEKAARLNPADPVPWQIALTHACGLQAPRHVFDSYLMEVMDRAPDHYPSHGAALQYLCAKWFGSHEEMFDFAEGVAERAEPGSLLHALPLEAVTEYRLANETSEAKGPVPPARIRSAIDRAVELSARYPVGDAAAAGFRNHLALALIESGRDGEALEAFRGIGVHARRFPWCYTADDPLESFLTLRKGLRVNIAKRIPFFSRPTGTARPAAEAPAAEPAVRSLALCAAPLRTVRESALLTGVTLRALAVPEGTLLEHVPSADSTRKRRGLRDTLLGEPSLTRAVDTMTEGEKWPALLLQRVEDRATATLYRDGDVVASHTWDLSAPAPGLEDARQTAEVFASAFGVADARPLAGLLRSPAGGPDRLVEFCAALGLRALPEGFGKRTEALDGLPGAVLLRRQSFFGAVKETFRDDDEGLMPNT